ncbi:hypothetical protein D3C84_1017760 [compost metagenome]
MQVGIALQVMIVVSVVVPTRGTDANAIIALVDDVHLGQHIEATLPHIAAVGGVIRLLVGGIVADMRVDRLRAPPKPKTQVRGPVDLQVGIAGIDGYGMGQGAGHCTEQQHRRQ